MAFNENAVRRGKLYRYKTLTCYAVEGAVAMIDEADNFTDVVPLADMKDRRRLVQQMIDAVLGGRLEAPIWMRVEQADRRALLAVYDNAIREAEDMGDPCDPQVQDYNRRHYRPKAISMRAQIVAAKNRSHNPYPELPALPRGRDRGVPMPHITAETWAPHPHDVYSPPKRKTAAGTQLLGR